MQLGKRWALKAVGTVLLSAGIAMASAQSGGTADAGGSPVVRVLNDRSTGDRWLLERDPAHPGGPGRLVRMEGGAPGSAIERGVVSKPPAMVIHAGERVTVEEKTVVVESRLEAVALSSAASGGALPVRLMVGGRVMHSVAVGPGRARMAVEAAK